MCSARLPHHSFLGAYVVSLNDSPVFTCEDIDRIIDELRASDTAPSTVKIELAPEKKANIVDRGPAFHLRMLDYLRIHALQSVAGEGQCVDDYSAELRKVTSSYDGVAVTADRLRNEYLLYRLQTDGMIEEERLLKNFSQNNLKGLPNWDIWKKCFDAQLDAQEETGTFGAPILHDKVEITDGERPNIL